MKMPTRKVVLLGGHGYTGRVLSALLAAQGHTIVSTSRSSRRTISDGGDPSSVWFDLSDPRSWKNIPTSEWLVWLFPAEPVDAVARVSSLIFEGDRRVVVVGTTSSYVNTGTHEELSEESSLDLEVPRVKGEELLRGLGANVLRSAGIYGPGRNPLDWLRRGRVSLGNYVNLIHVEDLASAIVAVLESPARGAHYIVTDGSPRKWLDIAAWAEMHGLVNRPSSRVQDSLSSRRLSNAKLLSDIGLALRHRDLFVELLNLEKREAGTSPDPEH
jgi:nucleoside-diphosphate-sugar epimerase